MRTKAGCLYGGLAMTFTMPPLFIPVHHKNVAILTKGNYKEISTPAAPLLRMRNSAGLSFSAAAVKYFKSHLSSKNQSGLKYCDPITPLIKMLSPLHLEIHKIRKCA